MCWSLGPPTGSSAPAWKTPSRPKSANSSRGTPAPTRKTGCATTGCCCWASGATGSTSRPSIPLFRMNDDASVRCYALLAEAEATRRRRRPAGAGPVAGAARRRRGLHRRRRTATQGREDQAPGRLAARAPGLRIRQAADRAPGRGLLKPEWVPTINSIYSQPARYLDGRVTAILPHTKELVTLALIRLADSDVQAAARELEPAALEDPAHAGGDQLGLGRDRQARRAPHVRRGAGLLRQRQPGLHAQRPPAVARACRPARPGLGAGAGRHRRPEREPAARPDLDLLARPRPAGAQGPGRRTAGPRPVPSPLPRRAASTSNWRWKNWASASPLRPRPSR